MIPKQYQYLEDLHGPKMLVEGLKLYGTKEIIGAKHNPVIMGWAEALDISKIYKSDETAWCGLSHAIVIIRSGKPLRLKGYDILRALKYSDFGEEVSLDEAMLGDTVVFKRPGGGHVGIYVAESLPSKKFKKGTIHVLGGNQNNSYGFTEIDRSRLVAVRRPKWLIAQPPEVKKYFIDSSGNVSTNEK